MVWYKLKIMNYLKKINDVMLQIKSIFYNTFYKLNTQNLLYLTKINIKIIMENNLRE